ncbi:ABC-type multidrug transporter, ATPase and permease components [Thiohalobacter thiocyanaticus]|uniref:ABC-type multidrug transporter, ATPase and permease components n=2 Tax=Thiohalobacteraceae TaxID=3085110 RepID=A0A1Z4VPH9_9GAMM|nr:ABC-type multidrug transporter, ATPase and permease components [Thiohalobacter thiocyanaticus]
MLGIPGRALVIWMGILVLAVFNGLLREAVLLPMLDQPLALILSGILLSVLILAVAYLSLPWLGRLPATAYIAIGLGWLCLTLVFEFAFGRLIQSRPWPELLDAYTFRDGNLWPLVLLVTAAAPYAGARLRRWV